MSYIYVIISSVLFGIFPTLQNQAILNGASPVFVVLFCNLICVAGSLLLCLVNRIDLKINAREAVCYFLSGLSIFITDYTLALSYTRIPVGLATMIHFVYPVLVYIATVLFFHNGIDAGRILAIVLSVSGLFLLNDGETVSDLRGVVYALVSALSYSCNLLLLERGPIREHEPFKKNFYMFAVALFFSLIMDPGNISFTDISGSQLIFMTMAGLSLICGSILLTNGIFLLGSSDSAFISTLEPVTSLAVSSLVYHYVLKPRSVIGCAFIILSLIPIMKKSGKQH